ncbi:hypothetical protein AG1IA_10019 [Rhizoctonia solani AG-1 IA]|uniref:Uncharacterized protein n=1 Tax=Thanatephorus cucumeris (strain AG1-IA) TaxID=983506 RepID=L8WCQ1_THACA|nr:hypothetical protein AG1IA_10019 [Rhizoctonia solani AG-1 IA]
MVSLLGSPCIQNVAHLVNRKFEIFIPIKRSFKTCRRSSCVCSLFIMHPGK